METRKIVGMQQDASGRTFNVVGIWNERGELLRWEEELVMLDLPEMEFKLHADSGAATIYRIWFEAGDMNMAVKEWNSHSGCYSEWQYRRPTALWSKWNKQA